MGNQTSSGSAKGKKVVASKFNMASKTGVLNLSEQGLKQKSSVWSQLADEELASKLKSLDLSQNSLKIIPAQVQSLLKLKTLIVSRCELTCLIDLRNLDQLTDIQAGDNYLGNGTLDGFPSSIQRCDLSMNRFSSFPLELITLVNLRDLNLSGNALESVDGIGAMALLTHVHLDNNLLRELPVEIGELRKLKFISLKCNLIGPRAVTRDSQSLPSGLFTDTSLDHIDLHGNADLRKADVMGFEGVEVFLERRRKTKDKSVQGGGLLDLTLFGIE